MPSRKRITSKTTPDTKASQKKRRPTTSCTIPGPVDSAVLNAFAPQQNEETKTIRNYVEWQSFKEKVTYVEKVLTERVFDRKMVAYDVHTDGERYWVITQPMNLYSQRLFPSLDYTLSFHILAIRRRIRLLQCLLSLALIGDHWHHTDQRQQTSFTP